jgi:hypothetical protein
MGTAAEGLLQMGAMQKSLGPSAEPIPRSVAGRESHGAVGRNERTQIGASLVGTPSPASEQHSLASKPP